MYKNSLFKRLSRTYIVTTVLPTLTVTLILTVLAFFLTDRSSIESHTAELQIMTENLHFFITSVEQSASRLAVDQSLQLFLKSNAKDPELVRKIQEDAANVLQNYRNYNSESISSIALATSSYTESMSGSCFQPLDVIDPDARQYMQKTNTPALWILRDKSAGGELCYIQRLSSQNKQVAFLIVYISRETFTYRISQNIPIRNIVMVMHYPMSKNINVGDPVFVPARSYSSVDKLVQPQGYLRQNGSIYFYDYILSLDMTVVYRADSDNYSNSFYLFIAVILLIGVGILMLRTAAMTHALRQRIDIIVDAIVQIERGNLKIHIPNDYQDDEISYVNDSLNNLTQLLGDTLDKLSKKEKEYLQAQLLALQNQINPHFIYNTIEIFRMQMEIANVSEASEAIASFGDMLRYNMDIGGKFSTLQKECEHAFNYIRIMNLRYEQNIHFSCQIPDIFQEVECPKFVLQPLVENAVKYNRHRLYETPLLLTLQIREEEPHILHIEVEDDGVGIPPKRQEELQKALWDIRKGKKLPHSHIESSIGLRNIARRLCLAYGEDGTLSLESKENQYTRITVSIPVRFTRKAERHSGEE